MRGSAAGPGHPAVDGSLTGADIANQSLTGADVAGKSLTGAHIADGSITGANIFGKSITAVNIADGTLTGSQIADKSLGGGKIADNSLTGASIDESSLGTVPSAANSAQLGGLAPGAFGTAVRSANQQSSECAVADANIECAGVTVNVPAGRSYDAIVWSTISAYHTESGVKAVLFCPAVTTNSTVCLTTSGGYQEGFNLQPNYEESATAVGTTATLGHHLGPGLWGFNTRVKLSYGGGSLASNDFAQVQTTVMLFDSAVPELPVDPPPGNGSSGTSSGGSSGTSSGGSSGTSGCSSSGGSSGTSGC